MNIKTHAFSSKFLLSENIPFMCAYVYEHWPNTVSKFYITNGLLLTWLYIE